ncbi:MAG: hypothetical protein QOF76_3343 [Solirubrobacteraceae bacterium]|nr:hypothetical protein [Solirubrobacteraceae bacterium]
MTIQDGNLEDFISHVRGYAILMLDADGRVQTWNEGARLMKGYEEDEILGAPYETFFPEQDRARGLPAELLAQAREHGTHESEGWRVRNDGSEFWALVHLTRIADADGRLRGYGNITKDMTDEHALKMQLSRRIDELASSNAELEQFAYVTSHDLSAPLRSIAGFSDLLRRHHAADLRPDAHDFLERIMLATNRMQALIDDLLAYSRAGRRELELTSFGLTDLVRETLAALRVSETDAEIAVAPLPEIIADRGLLAQVIENLVSNALKFSDGAPSVEIGAEETDATVRLWVADRGIGVPPEYADRIFTLFQRLHARDAYDGTGLGLAICQRVIERHGGTVGLQERTGGGTIFHLELPRQPLGPT